MSAPESERYSSEELGRLRAHYAALKDKASYDAFVRSAHDLLQRIGADPYHVRMAITRGKSMMEFGSRAAYRHSEGVGGIRVGLLMMEADVPLVPQEMNPNDHYFQPRGETAYVKFTVPTWTDIPADLLALNEKAMRWEYERIKDTKLVEIRRGSGTDNGALKYAVVTGTLVDDLHSVPGYWVLRADPAEFRAADALRDGRLGTWHLPPGKQWMKPGDKAVLWLTGEDPQCIGLATVSPSRGLLTPVDYLTRGWDDNKGRVFLHVDSAFPDFPLTWEDLKGHNVMEDFPALGDGAAIEITSDQYHLIHTLRNRMTQTNQPALNRIFYGPPGTGKTFHTVGAAVAVCDPVFYAQHKDDHAKLRERFNQLLVKDLKKAEGQIAFCTFHQSYSYEDFVEGIKPVEIEEDSVQQLRYHTRPGILKEMARRAMSRSGTDGPKHTNKVSFTPEQYDKAEVFKLSLGDSQNPEDQLIYDYCIKNNCVAIGFMEQHDLTGKSEQDVRALPLQPGQSSYHSKAMNFFSQYLNEGDIVVVTKGLYLVRAVGIVTGPYRYDPKSPIGYPHFRDVKWLMVDAEVPYEDLYTRQFSQQSIYKMKKSDLKRDFFVQSKSSSTTQPEEAKNFVLIIDEINRGNVAGIFGELITLIEENKRKGRPEALEVVLPYSQEPFSIPDNLYIIGTMNTADRSVEGLDAALRRRFSFVPMMPEPDKLKDLQSTRIDIKGLLKRMNERLVQLLDEDHQIGHSHFWELHKESDPIPALRQVFKDKIIPQLEEYFHRDRSKLQMVLGERFVKGADADPNLFLGDDQEGSFELRRLYTTTAKETWDEAAFLSIYEKA